MLSPITSHAITIIPPSPRDQAYSEIGKSFGKGISQGFLRATQKNKQDNQNRNEQGKTVTFQTILKLFHNEKYDECFILCESLLDDNFSKDDVFAIRSIMARCPISPGLGEKAALNADVIIRNTSLVDPLTLGFAWCHKCRYALTQEKNEDCLKYAEIALNILESVKQDVIKSFFTSTKSSYDLIGMASKLSFGSQVTGFLLANAVLNFKVKPEEKAENIT
jgi:hypothetical protein